MKKSRVYLSNLSYKHFIEHIQPKIPQITIAFKIFIIYYKKKK